MEYSLDRAQHAGEAVLYKNKLNSDNALRIPPLLKFTVKADGIASLGEILR